MQIINKMIQCPKCGCIAFPDAIHCPRCGSNYRELKANLERKEIFKKVDYLFIQGQENTDNTILKAYYKVTCPHHGHIDVKAAIVIPVMKCPICEEN